MSERMKRLAAAVETLNDLAEDVAQQLMSADHVRDMDEAQFKVHCMEESVLESINETRCRLYEKFGIELDDRHRRLLIAEQHCMERVTPEWYLRDQEHCVEYFAGALERAIEAILSFYREVVTT